MRTSGAVGYGVSQAFPDGEESLVRLRIDHCLRGPVS